MSSVKFRPSIGAYHLSFLFCPFYLYIDLPLLRGRENSRGASRSCTTDTSTGHQNQSPQYSLACGRRRSFQVLKMKHSLFLLLCPARGAAVLDTVLFSLE
ncbi:hypothetical protein CEXT_766891 [Caerostris extrusa]|uniref:Uncharacterized protein n=1 Tax=Caerostris extrusa TaxID=172846 RepID=A0AAV4MFX5_CAEEX|nr:hypothetical protein CEXT_766891 [Caerostris extrusa]